MVQPANKRLVTEAAVDANAAAAINDTASATRGALNATYAGKAEVAGKADAASVPSSINRWKSKLATDPANAKILLIGDSTSDPATDAGAIIARMKDVHTLPGEGLEGMTKTNITSQGRNGSKLLTEWMVTQAWTDAVIAAAPDLIIFSLGINDIRQGLKTAAEIKAGIISYINTLRAALPNCDFVLRTPNSFLSDDPGATGWLTPLSSAQLYSTQLRDTYGSLSNQWPNVVVWDSQDSLFGRTSRPLASSLGLMKDILHPSLTVGYPMIADRLVQEVIGHTARRTLTAPKPVDLLQASRPAYPYTFGDIVDRADSTTAPGTASSGQAYTMTGTVGVLGKRLYAPTAGNNRITADTGIADGEFGVTLAAMSTDANNYLIWRFTDSNNFLFLRARTVQYEISKIVGGVITDVVRFGAVASGDRMVVRSRGTTHNFFINDVHMYTLDIAENLTGTGIGLQLPATTSRWVDPFARRLIAR